MKKHLLRLCFMALLLCGCSNQTVAVDQETQQETAVLTTAVTVPVETELPAAIIRPEETAPVSSGTQIDDTIYVKTQVPVYDPALNLDYLIPGNGASEESLSCRYYHISDSGHMEIAPGVFRICTDPPEMRQGSHYGLFRMSDSGLQQLPENTFSHTYQVLDNEIPVTFSYALYGDVPVITYISPNELPFRIHDAVLGDHQCLISFRCRLKDVVTVDYPMILDVKSGELTDFLGTIEKGTLPSDLLLEGDNTGFFLQETALMEGNRLLAKLTGGKHYYYDPVNRQAWDLDELSGRQIDQCVVVGTDIFCYNGVDDIWKINGKNLAVTEVLSDIAYVEFFGGIWQGNGCSFVLYRDESWNLHAFDFLTMSDRVLREPDGWLLEGYRCHPSPDGRKLFLADSEDQTIQLLVFDCDQGKFLLIQRENPNNVQESRSAWTENNALVVITEDQRDHYVYNWKAWEEDVIEIQEPELPVRQDADFVRVKDYIPDILEDLKYAQPDNFTGQTIYEFQEVYLRFGTVMKLSAVQQELKSMGLGLKVWDGFRPVSAQFKLWEICPDDTYVANPNVGFSNHSRGFAVDLTLVDSQGRELVMPTEFDDFSGKADRNYTDCPEDAAQNAMLLQETMEKHGFAGYYGEWWHFNDSDRYEVEKCFDPAMISQWYADCQEYITLRSAPDTASEALNRIPAGGEFTCLGKTGEFLLAEYQGQRGYVLSSYARPM